MSRPLLDQFFGPILDEMEVVLKNQRDQRHEIENEALFLEKTELHHRAKSAGHRIAAGIGHDIIDENDNVPHMTLAILRELMGESVRRKGEL